MLHVWKVGDFRGKLVLFLLLRPHTHFARELIKRLSRGSESKFQTRAHPYMTLGTLLVQGLNSNFGGKWAT